MGLASFTKLRRLQAAKDEADRMAAKAKKSSHKPKIEPTGATKAKPAAKKAGE